VIGGVKKGGGKVAHGWSKERKRCLSNGVGGGGCGKKNALQGLGRVDRDRLHRAQKLSKLLEKTKGTGSASRRAFQLGDSHASNREKLKDLRGKSHLTCNEIGSRLFSSWR